MLLDGARRSGLFDRAALESWLGDVLDGRRDGMLLAWTLLSLQIWWECFVST